MPSRTPEAVRLLASPARLTRPKSAINGWPELVDQDVRGLEVAVDHPLAMGVVDRPGDRRHQPGRGLVVVAIASQVLRQVAAGNQLHAEEGMPLMPADLEDRHDVGMVQVGRRLGLGAEPPDLGLGGELSREDHLRARPRGRGSPGEPGRPPPCRRGPARPGARNRRTGAAHRARFPSACSSRPVAAPLRLAE